VKTLKEASPGPQMAAEAFVRKAYDDASGPLFGFVLRLTGDRALSEEIVQDVLVRAWQRAAHLNLGDDSLRRWLFTVARNVVTDRWRSRGPRVVALSHERLLGESADDDMDRVVQGWVLADALDRLRPKHREVLVEIYYEGSSVAEAARRLGIPPGTVKSRAHHALRALRLVLHETETF
jgi:RNA polymerase sigma-70 factor (ECF subfamily)